MQIKILGTKGEIKPSAPRHSRHSGVLVDRELLLDLGEREFLEYNPDAIFITHLHPDHAFFVTREQNIDINIPVYAPEKASISVHVAGYPDRIQVGRYSVLPIPTHHSIKVNSCAYLISNGEKKILYTGDMIWINRQYQHHLEGLDMVITDGSYIRKGGMVRRDKSSGQIYGHAGIPDLVDLFKPFTGFMVLVHFGNWFFKDIEESRRKIENVARQNNMIIETGYDGLTLDLNHR